MAYPVIAGALHTQTKGDQPMRIPYAKVWILLLFTLLANGCSFTRFEKPTIEEMGFISIMGFDYIDAEKMKTVVSVLKATPNLKETHQIFTSNVSLPHEALMVLPTKSEKTIVPQQMRAVLFSEEFATKRGLFQTVKGLYRDPRIGDNVLVAIVKGNVEELMSTKYQRAPELGTYINDLLRPRQETAFHPFTTIHDFIYDTTSGTADASLPFIEKKENKIQITKVAVLKDGKIAEYLSPKEGNAIQTLSNNKKLPSMYLEVAEKGKREKVVLHYIQNKTAISSNGDLQSPVFNIDIRLQATVLGYTGKRNLEETEQRQQLEKELAEKIKAITAATLLKLQKKQLDPAGLTERLRMHYRGKWKKQYGEKALQNATYRITVQVEIMGVGTLI